ncbi:uncharacterized protein YALI1_B00704g [Yarrowia lipolytica]|uniref:Uncharacterized protein n=1 Tax=Yarrowia lipolytica TaxID=4952 RepID=A0A1D8N5U5_YARLL|nr:hypothetical protein YALI1_B00704g [Yarrowia lipolytica]
MRPRLDCRVDGVDKQKKEKNQPKKPQLNELQPEADEATKRRSDQATERPSNQATKQPSDQSTKRPIDQVTKSTHLVPEYLPLHTSIPLSPHPVALAKGTGSEKRRKKSTENSRQPWLLPPLVPVDSYVRIYKYLYPGPLNTTLHGIGVRHTVRQIASKGMLKVHQRWRMGPCGVRQKRGISKSKPVA